jgi:hypothetical protein
MFEYSTKGQGFLCANKNLVQHILITTLFDPGLKIMGVLQPKKIVDNIRNMRIEKDADCLFFGHKKANVSNAKNNINLHSLDIL